MAEPIERNEKFLAQLMRHEGTKRAPDGSHVAYRCPAGALTIGYGHNLDANPIDGLNAFSVMSEAQARKILLADVAAFAAALDEKMPWWRRLNAPRQAVLLNMAFNMGMTSLLGFRRTLQAVREQRWKDARDGMLASKWAGQVGRRASELAEQMLTGQWQG
ncbi:glycoside hydrolase family protein [uncultured Desulfovibrio sp.]|uniref:glycoside hydrolase family protein n=1 Tax=uncultured Desulfovibrio sp. TaxID=167968 RepID=UPI002729DDC9|nr:glycoside hydrolase family protein [uncultured Desulfovibrio sp.]